MSESVARLMRRFRNARRRAAYWSGRPSLTGAGHRVKRTDASIMYEQAMTDQKNLAADIALLTGRLPVVRDYKAEVAASVVRALAAPGDPRR